MAFSFRRLIGGEAPKAAPAREEDSFLEQVPRLRLELRFDDHQALQAGRLFLKLRFVNNTDREVSPVLLILWARNSAWYLNDPRMGKTRMEFSLADFGRKTLPGESRDYAMNARQSATIKAGDGVWVSFSYRGAGKDMESNLARVPEA